MRTERLLLNGTGVADATGVLTIVFPPVPESLVWTVAASIVGSVPSTGHWKVKLGFTAGQQALGSVVGSFNGNGPLDHIQAWGTERLIIVGSGLTVGASYTVVIAGQSNWEGEQPMAGSRLIEQVVAPVAAGVVMFHFPPVPQGQTWIGRCLVPDATAGDWIATLNGGQMIGGWTGSQTFGPVHLLGGESLTISGTNVTPTGADLVAILLGLAQDDGLEPWQLALLLTANEGDSAGASVAPPPVASVPMFSQVTKTGLDQPVPHATFPPVTVVWVNEIIDEAGGFDLATFNTRFTAVTDCRIDIGVRIGWIAKPVVSEALYRAVMLYKNGVFYCWLETQSHEDIQGTIHNLSEKIDLLAGDYLEIKVYALAVDSSADAIETGFVPTWSIFSWDTT